MDSFMDYAVLDFETTGSCRGNANLPWQLGVVKMTDRRVVPEESCSFYLKVPKDHQFNPYAPGRWATIRDILAESPSLLALWPDLQPWLSGHFLVAHNVPTERTILCKTFPLHHFGPWFDTLTLTRKAYPQLSSYQLEEIIATLNILPTVQKQCPNLAPHDALFDAFAAAYLLEHLLHLPGWSDLPDRCFLSN